MAEQTIVQFLIDHIDPLGQGVYKDGEDIYFIPKTLPGETGSALVLKKKSNINFCRLLSLKTVAPNRVEPACPHFAQCPSCHFLHTNYASELDYKRQSLERLLRPLGAQNIEVVPAPKRLGYRNRVQFHYHKRSRSLGYTQARENKILSVPQCKIYREELAPAVKEIFSTWSRLAKKPRGHVEIYLNPEKDKAPRINWDRPYADGGFTQVNEEMNRTLIETLADALKGIQVSNALDLFGGNGNLAGALPAGAQVHHIDLYPDGDRDNFYSLDLFNPDSLENFVSKTGISSSDLFLVDPPRAGFKELSRWVERLSPRFLAYVSCHPQTMARDLRSLQRPYEVVEAKFMDLFPSTFHSEAFALLRFE